MNQRTTQSRGDHIDALDSSSSPEVVEVASLLSHLTAAALFPFEINGAHFVNVPEGYQHKDITEAIEQAQAAPSRKRGVFTLKDVDSLLVYLQDQKAQEGAYVYADPDKRTITAVFNDLRAEAGWRDHRAQFVAEFTPEFQRWLSGSGASNAKGQAEFAEFIEDNLGDITEPAAQQLLDVATTIQAATGIEFKAARRLDNGQAQLTYIENVEARAGVDGSLQIPKAFNLGLRIFKNGDGYKLTARLKYRLSGGSVRFWYELERPERAVEDAFKGYIDKVRESGYTVLLGAA